MSLPPAAQSIANAADRNLSAKWANARAMQDNYLASHGLYWQGIVTQDEPPGDGRAATPAQDRKPTDRPHSWRDVGAHTLFPNSINTRLAVDVYDGPDGKGWVVRFDFVSEGVHYAKAVNVGPETWRSQDWLEVDNGSD